MLATPQATDVALGIDVGTSGVRVVATDRAGATIAMATAPIPVPLQTGERIEQDAEVWWQAVAAALTALDVDKARVRAIAVDGTSGTILPIADDGTPVAKASLYNDRAEPQHVARVAAVAPAETAALGSTSPLARAMRFGGDGRIIHQADWIAGRLGGRFDVSDENNALKSGYDPVSRCWPQWIEATGFDRRRFPRVRAAASPLGPVTAAIAQQFGLAADCIVVAGTTDGCAAFLASGASEPGDGVTSLGTTLTIKLLSATPVFAPQFGIYSHRIGDLWLAGGASNTGGAVIDAHFNKDDLAKLTPLLDPDRPTGLDYYPLPKPGERFPIADPAYPPRLTPRPPEDHQFLQALLEGIAAIEALGYRRLAELGASKLGSIRTLGGGAENSAWTAMRLRALGVVDRRPLSRHAAVGTARLAWWGLGHAAA